MSNWVDKVHALADGELQGEEQAEALAFLDSDPRAKAEHQWAVYLKQTLQDKVQPVRDDEAWSVCRERIRALDKRKSAEVFVGKYAWAFCLIFLVGIFSAATLNRTGRMRPLANEHVAALFNGLTPLSFPDSQQAFDSAYNSVGAPPATVDGDAKVRSLEIGYVDGRKAAHMILEDHIGPMDLFVLSGTSSVEGIEQREGGYLWGQVNGVPAISWTESGCLFLVVTHRDPDGLRSAASQVRRRG
ncbi:MAG: hypothetical protein JST30_07170 [Armatimonadetes bacterium]|nr:hypothetical protein [Armatimonadota bacterium]